MIRNFVNCEKMNGKTLIKLIPREHGAWAMWLVPYVAGVALAARPTWRFFAFAVGALLLFVARGEFTRWGRRGFRARDLKSRPETSLAVAPGSLGASLALVCLSPGFTPLTALYFVFVFVLVASTMALGFLRQERSLGGELLGILLLTASGPVALIIGGTEDLRRLVAFHGINFLFFSLSIFYVRAKVAGLRRQQNRLPLWIKARLGGLALAYLAFVHLTLWGLVRAGLVPAVMFAAFLPITVHTVVGVVRLDRPLNLRRLGFAELAQSLVFLASLLLLWTA